MFLLFCLFFIAFCKIEITFDDDILIFMMWFISSPFWEFLSCSSRPWCLLIQQNFSKKGQMENILDFVGCLLKLLNSAIVA